MWRTERHRVTADQVALEGGALGGVDAVAGQRPAARGEPVDVGVGGGEVAHERRAALHPGVRRRVQDERRAVARDLIEVVGREAHAERD